MPRLADLLDPETRERLMAAPRNTDSITEKETPVPDVDKMSDAEIANAVREKVRKKIADELPAKAKKAKKKAKVKEEKASKEHKEARRDMAAIGMLPGFTVKGIEIPALDVSALENLDEAVSGKVRSPYNKARYRLKMGLLPYATGEQIKEDPTTPTTTWLTLVNVHQELAGMAEHVAEAEAEIAAAEPKQAKRPKSKKGDVVIAAHVDLDEKAKIAVLRQTLGVSKKRAKEMLVEVGLA